MKAEPMLATGTPVVTKNFAGRPHHLGPILRGQVTFRMMRGELERAKHHAQEMRHFGDAPDNVMWKCIGSLLSGNVCLWYGEFIDARGYYENALSSWNPKFRTSVGAPVDPYVSILSLLYLTLVCLGDLNQARLRRDEALAEARRLSPYNLTFTLGNISLGDWLLVGRTSTRTFLMLADEILTLSREQRFPLYVGYETAIRGWGLAERGQAMQGIPLVLEGLEVGRATGAILQIPIGLAMLADTYRIAGQPEDGLNQLAEATNLVETTQQQQRWALAEIHRLRGGTIPIYARSCRSRGQLSARHGPGAAAEREAVGATRGPRPCATLA